MRFYYARLLFLFRVGVAGVECLRLPRLISGCKVVRWAEPERGQSARGLEAIYERLKVCTTGRYCYL